MKDQTSIPEIVIAISSCLIKSNISFCIAGGIAVSLWGHVRATEDIDIIALLDETNETKFISALQNHFKILPHKEKMLQSTFTPIKRYVIVHNSFHFVIDILLATNDILKHCIQNSKLFSIKDIKIPVINLEDLIVIKCVAGRYQDIADIQALVRGSIPVNKDYIVKQLELLHIPMPEAVTPFILQ